MSELAWIFFSTLLVNNFTLAMFLGLCSFFGVTSKVDTAWRLGAANTFVLVITAVSVWLLNTFLLSRTPFLRTIAFIVVIASTVQIVEMVIKKFLPALFRELGIYLPLITTNCAVLGVAILVIKKDYNLAESVVFTVATALGFALALVIFSGIREQLALADVPKAMKGIPIALVTAGILALAFMGFAGMV